MFGQYQAPNNAIDNNLRGVSATGEPLQEKQAVSQKTADVAAARRDETHQANNNSDSEQSVEAVAQIKTFKMQRSKNRVAAAWANMTSGKGSENPQESDDGNKMMTTSLLSQATSSKLSQ